MAFHWLRDIRSVLYEDIARRNKQAPFIIFLSFVIAFAVSRIVVLLGPESLRLFVKHYHIHHFYYGFALLALSSWIALTTNRQHMFRVAAILFGIGLGLFVDEFGLLLTCTTPQLECDYWARQSYDAFVLIAGGLLAVLYSRPALAISARLFRRLVFRKRNNN
jgi:hypothetical protein